MNKLKKSTKTILIAFVSIICTVAIVLGCVFGLKKKDNSNPTAQGYELTSSQKLLMSAVNANSSNYYTDNSKVIAEFDESKYVDESGTKISIENIDAFEKTYFVSKDFLNRQNLFFYPETGKTKSTSLLTALKTLDAEKYNTSELSILGVNKNFVCYLYKTSDGTNAYRHYEMACIKSATEIEVVQEYVIEVDYLDKMNYLGKYPNCMTYFYDDFYLFLFYTDDQKQISVDVFTYASTKEKTLKASIADIVIAEGGKSNFESKSGFYILNNNVVSVYSVQDGKIKNFVFNENTDVNHYYSYKLTEIGLFIEECVKIDGGLNSAPKGTFHDKNEKTYATSNYKLLNFKTGKIQSINLKDGYVKAVANDVAGFNGFYIFAQKVDAEKELISKGQIIYFDENLNPILKYDANSINDSVKAANNTNFLTAKGLFSTKKTVNAETILDFEKLNYILLSEPNNGTFAIDNVNLSGINVFDLSGKLVFDDLFSDITPYEDGYYFAKQGNKNYILNVAKPNNPRLIEGFSDIINNFIKSGSGIYSTETKVDGQKVYSFYDFKGNVIAENVAYSTIDLEYNEEYNYSNLSFVTGKGEKKSFVKPNANLSGVSVSIDESPTIAPYAEIDGSGELSDDLSSSTDYPELQETSSTITIRRANGRYPSAGKIQFEDTTTLLVITTHHYFEFTASPQAVKDDELSITVTTKNVTTPGYYGRFVLPASLNTGIGYVGFTIGAINYTYESTTVTSTGYCYADLEFFIQNEDEVYSSSTNTADNQENYEMVDSQQLQTLYSSATIESTAIVNKVQGAKLTKFTTQNARGITVNLNGTRSATKFTTESFNTKYYIYNVHTIDYDTRLETAYTATNFKMVAYYSPIAYKIKYELGGGAFAEDQTASVYFGTTFSVANPTKFGYTFNGWNISGMDGCTHTFGSTTTTTTTNYTTATSFKNLTSVENAEITFTASWLPIYYYVEQDANGGHVTFDSTLDSVGDNIVSFENICAFSKLNRGSAYVAYGYNSSSKKSGPILISQTENAVHYAKVDINNGLLTQYTTTGTITLGGNTYYYATDSGWTSGNYLDAPGSTRIKVTGSSLTSMIETFYLMIKNDSRAAFIVNYDQVFEIQVPEKVGYTVSNYAISGMSDSYHEYSEDGLSFSNGSELETDFVEPRFTFFRNLYDTQDPYNEVLIHTNWTAITYNLSFNYSGGALESGLENPTTATYDTTFSVYEPVKEGYIFNGWTITNAAGYTINSRTTDSSFKNLSSTQDAEICFTANWIETDYIVSFNFNEGNDLGLFEQNLVTTTDIFFENEIYQIVKTNNQPAYVLPVIYQSSMLGVVFMGETASSVKVTVFNKVDSTSADYSYYGTYTAPDGNTYYYSGTNAFVSGIIEDDTSMYDYFFNLPIFTWIETSNITDVPVRMYTIYSHYIKVNYTEEFTVANPTKEGAEFSGWTINNTKDGTLTGVFDTTFSKLTADDYTISFNAQWGQNEYSISYDYDGGTKGTYAPSTAVVGSMFIVSQPTRLGYVFNGWYVSGMNSTNIGYGSEGNFYNESISTTTKYFTTEYLSPKDSPEEFSEYFFYNLRISSGTVTFKALWTGATYSVAYDLNDTGDAVHSGNKPSSATYSLAFDVSMPTRDGYEFLGWTFSGLTNDCEHVYWAYGEDNLPINFSSSNGNYYDYPDNPSSLKVVKSTKFKNLRTSSGTVTLTAVWKSIILNVTYHYLPLNFDALAIEATQINKLSAMTETKSTTIQFGKPFVPYIGSNSGGTGETEVPVPNGVRLVYWAFSTTANFATYSAVSSGSSFTAQSGTQLFVPNDEVIYTYSSGDVHAYAVYAYPDITVKYYIPSGAGLGNDLSNYVYMGEDYDATVSLGSSYVVKNSVTVDNTSFVGWMVSANHYLNGTLSEESVSTYVYGGTDYAMVKGRTVVWGYTNTATYDVDNPVYYLYAVYTYSPTIALSAVSEDASFANISTTVIAATESTLNEQILPSKEY